MRIVLKAAKIGSAIVIAAMAILLAIAAAMPQRAVLISIDPDPAMIRPRTWCVMNPFRDRTRERPAERFLSALRAGDMGVLAVVSDAEARAHFADRETEYTIQRWRVGRREDHPDRTELMYWVTRGNGYDAEEEVHLVVSSGRVVQFSAVY